MAAPVVAGTATSAATSSYQNSWNVSLPSSIASGDLLLVTLSSTSGSVDFDTPSGWTELLAATHTAGYPRSFQVFARDADGTEGATQTFSFPAGNFLGYAGNALRITGWSGTVGDIDVSSMQTGSGSSIDAPALTTSIDVANRLVLRLLGGSDRTSWTPPSGVTLEANVTSDPTHNCENRSYTDDDASVGAITFSNSGTPSGPLLACTIAVPGDPNVDVAAATVATPVAVPALTLEAISTEISRVATGTPSEGSTTVTPAIPAGWQPGDLALVLVGFHNTGSAVPTSITSGWDEVAVQAISGSRYVAVYRRILEAGDGDPTFGNSGGTTIGAGIVVYRGVDADTPIDVTPVGSTSAAATTWVPTGVTTVTNGAWAISVAGTADNNALGVDATDHNGFTEVAGGTSWDYTTGTDLSTGLAEKTIATAGAVTMCEWRQTVNGSDAWAAISFALRPASVAGSALVPPDTVETPVAVPSPTLTSSSSSSSLTVATPVAVPDPTETASASFTVAAVATPVAVPSPTPLTGTVAAAAAVATPVTVPAPTETATATVPPAVVATPVAVPVAGLVSIPVPSPVPTPVAVPAPTLTATATSSSSVVATPVAVPGPTLTATATLTPTPVPTPVAVPAPGQASLPELVPVPTPVAVPDPVIVALNGIYATFWRIHTARARWGLEGRAARWELEDAAARWDAAPDPMEVLT